ncbi:hypothetical protein M3J09_001153 [Ascochyta lentis]
MHDVAALPQLLQTHRHPTSQAGKARCVSTPQTGYAGVTLNVSAPCMNLAERSANTAHLRVGS